MNGSNLLLLWHTVCVESFSLLAGSFLFDEKTRQSDALFWFGLRDVGILIIFYTQELSSKEKLLTLRILKPGLAD
jgi:hypothetical protein